MLSKFKLNQLYFKDTQFANLMTRRIFNVLLIANPYDAFMLEDDGRIDEKIFNEYTSLSLRYPPRFSQVSTEEEAMAQLANMSFDLVICMPGTGDNDSFAIGRRIKEKYEHLPIVILTPGQHRPAGIHHQADGGQDESGTRRAGGGRTADSAGGRRHTLLLVHPA